MTVLDASCVLELLLQRPTSQQVSERLSDAADDWVAPSLLDVEVCHVLRRYFLAGELSARRGREAIDDLADMPLERYPHTLLLDRMWQLRNNITSYDAAYVALAEALDAPLLTCDKKLAGASGHRAKVVVVG